MKKMYYISTVFVVVRVWVRAPEISSGKVVVLCLELTAIYISSAHVGEKEFSKAELFLSSALSAQPCQK